MAPKRQRVSKKYSNGVHEAYDHAKFVNLEASRYSFLVNNRKFIVEKSFEHLGGFFKKTIASNRWNEFSKPCKPIVAAVVREFYVSLKEQLLMKVWVRNTWGTI